AVRGRLDRRARPARARRNAQRGVRAEVPDRRIAVVVFLGGTGILPVREGAQARCLCHQSPDHTGGPTMTRICLTAGVVCLLAGTPLAAADAPRPNVVFVLADDLGRED